MKKVIKINKTIDVNRKNCYIFAITKQNPYIYMQIIKGARSGKGNEITDANVVCNNPKEFADAIIHFIQIFGQRLSKTEKDFMLASIDAKSKGFSLYDKDCSDYIMKNSEFNTKFAIDKHRMNLIKKGWITKKGHKFDINGAFISSNFEDTVKINFTIKNNNS